MKTLTYFLSIAFVFTTFMLHSQETFVFEKDVQTPEIRGKKFTKNFLYWSENQNQTTIKYNNKADTIKAIGKYIFTNQVKYPGSETIGRTYVNQSNGVINYELMIICQEDHYIFRFYNFEHVSSAKGEKISFGKILSGNNPPAYISQDYDSDWAISVWNYIKENCQEQSTAIISNIVQNLAEAK